MSTKMHITAAYACPDETQVMAEFGYAAQRQNGPTRPVDSGVAHDALPFPYLYTVNDKVQQVIVQAASSQGSSRARGFLRRAQGLSRNNRATGLLARRERRAYPGWYAWSEKCSQRA